jgi:hypothetical protein
MLNDASTNVGYPPQVDVRFILTALCQNDDAFRWLAPIFSVGLYRMVCLRFCVFARLDDVFRSSLT